MNWKTCLLAYHLMFGVLVVRSSCVSAAEGASPAVSPILEAVLARAESIQTGTIRFVCTLGWEYDGEVPTVVLPDDFPGEVSKQPTRSDESAQSEKIVTFAGTDWVQRYPGSKGRRLNRGEFNMILAGEGNLNGPPRAYLRIGTPEGALDQGYTVEQWKLILRCGTIPLPPMEQYIRQHREEARYAGQRMVSVHNCQVLEWEVGMFDFNKAFYFHPENFRGQQAAILRLLVAEELGHAVVKVEYSTLDGEVRFWFEGADFHEVAPAIFFPFVWTQHNEKQDSRNSYEYKISSFDGVNQPLPEDAFAINVPKGARVRDKRPGKETVFRLGETKTIRDVDEVVRAARQSGKEQLAARPASSPTVHILVWFNVAALVLIAAVWGVRRWRKG